ncbi:MAG: hypothetical protein ACR2JY_19020 [Chloroflexota bacterium]
MADGTGGNRWAAVSQTVDEEMQAWQRAHPVATLTEIEVAVEAATAKLQARLIQDLAQDMDEVVTGAVEQPDCPHCGTRLKRRGRRERLVLVAHQPQPVRLEREYFVCPTCGVGFSPPR